MLVCNYFLKLGENRTMNYKKELLFWISVAGILVLLFGRSYDSYLYAFYFVAFLLPVIVGATYIFSLVIIPNHLLTKRYFYFVLYTLYTIIISAYFEMVVIVLAFILLANYQYEQMLPATKDIFGLTITMYFIVLVKTVIVLISQLSKRRAMIQVLEQENKNYQVGFLTVRADRKRVKLLYDDILFLESLGDYLRIHLDAKPPVLTKEKISTLEQKLSPAFIRIHRSFIVNLYRVASYTSKFVVISDEEVPISRTYRKQAFQKLQSHSS